ncbi:MAG: class I SAM-dependent methyltransferase [Bacteroidia bacterium]
MRPDDRHPESDQNRLAVEAFDLRAMVYQERFMDVSSYAASLNAFCDGIPNPQAHILELACGPGNVTKYLLDRRPGWRIIATDLAPTMVQLAQANNPTADCRVMDARDLGAIQDRFDGVMVGFGLPYFTLLEAKQMIQDAARLLLPGGLIYLSSMEDDPSRSGIMTNSYGDQVFMNYHLGADLLAILREMGFSVTYLHRQDFLRPDGSKWHDLLIVAQL